MSSIRFVCSTAITTVFGMWALSTFVYNGVLVIPVKEKIQKPTVVSEPLLFSCEYNALSIPMKVGESRQFLFKNCPVRHNVKIDCDGKECSIKAVNENTVREVTDQQMIIPPNPKIYDLSVTITAGKYLTYTLFIDTSPAPI